MKNTGAVVLLISIALVSCAPQVTVTSEVTATLTPIPAPTLHPQFIALQESIAASGGRFTLNSDGLIYDGETPIPGLTVAPDGAMTLTVNGKEITLDPVKAVFDDEDGFSYPGYKWDATADDGAGAWVEANETVTANFDLGVVLSPGEANEDGSRNIETFVPPEKFADNEGAVAKWLKYFDAERLGFDPGATQWILTEDNEAVLVDSQNHDIRIARWGYIEWLKKAGIIWNWLNFVEADGENVLFDVCKIWELTKKGGVPLDKDGVLDFIRSLQSVEGSRVASGADMMYGSGDELSIGGRGGSVQSSDGRSMIVYQQSRFSNDEGFLETRTYSEDPNVKPESIILYVENMEWDFYAK